jgi:hypothetical protein
VIVDGVLQTRASTTRRDADATLGANARVATSRSRPRRRTARIRFVLLHDAAKSTRRRVHASTIVKPAAVRGRNICVFLGSGGSRQKVGSVQAFELEATVDGEIEREFCNEEIVGRTINGRDCTGTLTSCAEERGRLPGAALEGHRRPGGEVYRLAEHHAIPLEVQIQNPKNPAQILKTLYVDDAIFQPPARRRASTRPPTSRSAGPAPPEPAVLGAEIGRKAAHGRAPR